MECEHCKKSTNDEDFILGTKFHRVFLFSDQSYLGRCRIVTKRHIESLSDLSEEEWLDLSQLTKKLESAVKKAFGATMFNWSCLMNNAYKKSPPTPHIHWHFRPRYNKEVNFKGEIFVDPEFGNHYNRERKKDASFELRKKIIEAIKDAM